MNAPSSFGPFTLLSLLGTGEFTEVWHARDAQDREVRLKIFPGKWKEEYPEFGEALVRGAERLKAFSHPGIPALYAVGENEEGWYASWEYREGRTLRELTGVWGSIDLEFSGHLVEKLAAILDEAHAAGLVHGNLMASNVLFQASDGELALLDFGLPPPPENPAQSPEQDREEEAVPASDICGLAAMINRRKRLEVTKYKGILPPGAVDALLKAQADWPYQRQATAGEFAREFNAGLRAQPVEPLADSPVVAAAAGHTWKRPLYKVMAIVAVVAFVNATGVFYQWISATYSTSRRKDEGKLEPAAGVEKKGVVPLECPKNFIAIPPGTFPMGAPLKDRPADKRDALEPHQVTLTKAFCLSKFEVTQKEWTEVMGSNPSHFLNCGEDCPVEQVSWNDIQEFLVRYNALHGGGYRLPTSAEWEYAARAGTTTAGYAGEIYETGCLIDPNLDGIGWYCANSEDRTHRVGEKEPNAWGLYDMLGNVSEFASDWYDEKYTKEAQVDPGGSPAGTMHTSRGGDWITPARYCNSSVILSVGPHRQHYARGFRLVWQPLR